MSPIEIGMLFGLAYFGWHVGPVILMLPWIIAEELHQRKHRKRRAKRDGQFPLV